MGSDGLALRTGASRRRFNSRSRMGSDDLHPTALDDAEVSIHAPAWGATTCRPSGTSVPTFQFTLPHGERRRRPNRQTRTLRVSIHAPAWGATRRPARRRGRAPSFNSRSRMGSDNHPGRRRPRRPTVSIHAPAWGATRPQTARRRGCSGFNSRSRMGSDKRKEIAEQDALVSIHAPAWGATLHRRGLPKRRQVSIHAPAWGATSVSKG